MWPQRIIRFDCCGNQVGPLGFDAMINLLTVIAEGPPVKGAVANSGHVIRHQVAAELIALVDHRPQRAGLWFPCHAHWIAKPRREDPMAARVRVDLPDRSPFL